MSQSHGHGSKRPLSWLCTRVRGQGTNVPVTDPLHLSVPGKVFAHSLIARIQPLLVSRPRPKQSGFTMDRSTTDAVFTLRVLSEIHHELNCPLIVAYVDLKAAFDSVDCQALWSALRGFGFPNFLLDLIKDLHSGTTARVRVHSSLSEEVITTSGVRQGFVLAPALFSRAMNWILEQTASKNGVKLPEHDFSDLDYADDVALVDESASKLATSLEYLEREASHLGLQVS